MNDGFLLEYFVNNQKKPKKQIASDLGMSRNNLYALFSSKILKPETKVKFETYFNTEIFSGDNLIRAEKSLLNISQKLEEVQKKLEEGQNEYNDIVISLGKENSEHFEAFKQNNDASILSKNLWQAKVQECNDLRERIGELKEMISTQKLLVETQQKLIEKLEYQLKPSNNSEAKERVNG